jgi:hypothetical protein
VAIGVFGRFKIRVIKHDVVQIGLGELHPLKVGVPGGGVVQVGLFEIRIGEAELSRAAETRFASYQEASLKFALKASNCPACAN